MEPEIAGSVLSDSTIRTHLAALIDDGTAKNAREVGYEFLPGKLYPAGESHEGKPLDWTQPGLPPETSYAVKRGELLLVRTRERVKMPAHLCGLWSQLDRNSRQGLLLVNTSVVPPGYDGFLACTFVNFGNKSLLLKPHWPIARLVFLRLDAPAAETGQSYAAPDYDQRMSDAAREAPSTFLAIAERTASLNTIVEDAKKALDEQAKGIRAGAETALAASVKNATESLEAAGRSQKAQLDTDAVGAVKKAFPLALLVIAVLTGADWLVTKAVSSNIDALAKERADRIETKINEQLAAVPGGKPVIVYTGSAEGKALSDRLTALEDQIRVLAQKAAAGQTPPSQTKPKVP
jgi:hypothetical protein